MPSTVTDRIDGLTTSVAVKAPCIVATSANVVLAGLQTISGVTLVDGDRVLVMSQTTTTQNGIYVAHSTAWERARDFDGSRDAVPGTLVVVRGSGSDVIYKTVCSDNPVVFGTSSITFALASFGDSSTVSFIQAGTGAVAMSMRTAMRDVAITPEQFGCVGNGVTVETSNFQAMLNAVSSGMSIYLSRHYVVADSLTLTGVSRFRIFGPGRITQTVANKPILKLTSCSEFEVRGIYFYGLGTDFNTAADTSTGDGIRVDTCSDFAIACCTFKNFGYTAVRAINSCFDFSISDNWIYGTHGLTTSVVAGDNYQFGVIVQSGSGLLSPCTDFEISRNRIRNTAIGVRIEPFSARYALRGNVIANTKGQHGFYLNGTCLTVEGNTLDNIAGIGVKLQSYRVVGLPTEGVSAASVVGNTVRTCQSGIAVEKTDSVAPNGSMVTISGNTVSGANTGAAGYGIVAQDVVGLVIEGNTINGGTYGILGSVITAGTGVGGRIAGNYITDTQWAGINAYGYQSLAVVGNTVIRPCLAALTGDTQKSAIWVGAASTSHRIKVAGNSLLTDTSTGVVNGIFAATVDLDMGDNDLEAKIIVTSSCTMRKRAMYGDYTGSSALTGIPQVVAGATQVQTVAVSGAVGSDSVVGLSFSSDLQGCSMSGYLTANQLNVVFTNNTGGNVTLANGTLRYSIMRYAV